MALLHVLGFTCLVLAASEPQSTPTPTPVSTEQDIRVILFIRAPKKLQRAVIEQIAIPVGQDIELVPMDEFQAAAKRAHLYRGSSLRAAVALAHPLRLSHVVTIKVVQPGHKRHARGESHTFLEVFVGRLRPTREIISAKRYNLQNGKLTASMAQIIATRIKSQVNIPPKAARKPAAEVEGGAQQALKPSDDQPKAAAATDPNSNKRLGIDSDLDPLTQDMMAEQQAESDAVQAQKAENANRVLQLRGSVAMAVVQRTAYLRAGVSGESPPCFCGNGALSNTYIGLHAAAALFFQAGLPGVGLMGDLTTYWPDSEVQTDGMPRNIRSFVTDLRLALAWRWHSSIGIELVPRVGWGLFDFPLSDGAFPGLSYSYPFLGLDVAYILAGGKWRFDVAFDYLPTLSTGEDAVRLGQKTDSSGVQAMAGVEWDTGPVQVGLSFTYAKRDAGFAGLTFLFTEQTFDNVSLSDQQTQLLLSVGTRFW